MFLSVFPQVFHSSAFNVGTRAREEKEEKEKASQSPRD
jgi:hypothetical protein